TRVDPTALAAPGPATSARSSNGAARRAARRFAAACLAASALVDPAFAGFLPPVLLSSRIPGQDAEDSTVPSSTGTLAQPVRGSAPALPACNLIDVRSLEPANGSTVGPRPVFRMSVRVERDCEGLDPIIQISHDSWKTVERSWE